MAHPALPPRGLQAQRAISFDERVDILVTGLFPGRGDPGPIAFPNPADVSELIADRRVVNLPTLIQLKLAARRYQDFADVVNLIGHHKLDESYLGKLHASLHADYIERLEGQRREDEYEARQDERFQEQKPPRHDNPSPPSGPTGG